MMTNVTHKYIIYRKWNIINFVFIVILIVWFPIPVVTQVNNCVSSTVKCGCFVENGEKIINCRYKNLTVIPAFTDTNQVYNEIRFTSTEGTCFPNAVCNNIRQINANDFANLKVRKLDLRNNPLSYVDNGAFLELIPELESLLLEGDGVYEFPYQAIAPLGQHLKYLHLEHFGSRALQSPTVFPFPNLVSLSFENWPHLEYFNADIFDITHSLKEVKLTRLPALLSVPVPLIQKFPRLTNIVITQTGIKTIFRGTFTQFSMLNDIKVYRNRQLKHIDIAAFGGVSDSVTRIDIDYNALNNIEFLRSENWTSLRYLNIGYNNLKSLPEGIFSKAPLLYELNCQNIGLTNIDGAMFFGLSNLGILDLAYNKIKTITTGAFRNLPTLTELRLNDQNIQYEHITFQKNVFYGIGTAVENLNLANNKVDLNQFFSGLSELKNLKILNMRNVSINSIPDKTFRCNTKLENLVLSNNNITSLNQSTFYGPRNTLQTIDLHGNNIKYIDQCTFSDLPIKPTLILSPGNQLSCTCELVWLYDWFRNQSNQEFLSVNIGECHSPKNLSGKYFSEFSKADMCPGGVILKLCPDLFATHSNTLPRSTIGTRLLSTTPTSGATVKLSNNNTAHSPVESGLIVG